MVRLANYSTGLVLVLMLMLMLLANSCKASDEEVLYTNGVSRRLEEDGFGDFLYNVAFFDGKVTASPTPAVTAKARAPPNYDRTEDVGRYSNAQKEGFGPKSATNQDEMERNREVDGETPPQSIDWRDDDYIVVVLDDLAPWDLSEGTTAKIEDGPTLAPTVQQGQLVRDINDDDDDDYLAVILEDDVPWDDISVAEYAKDKFEEISNANSNSSIDDELEYDDDEDWDLDLSPTPLPTLLTSPTTGKPTILPTPIPTRFPTVYPSSLPTVTASQAPSASPTISCHDKVGYRSPINGLRCWHHRETDCLNWRYIGLNMTELEELVQSCPQTCEIECGSFQLFSAPVSFRISRISGFMDPQDVESLTNFAIDYLEGFVRKYIAKDLTEKSKEMDAKKVANTIESEDQQGDDGSKSNDILQSRLEKEDIENDDDDFLSDNVVEGDDIVFVFEIESAELTAQNLVEEEIIVPIGRIEDVFEDIENLVNSTNSTDGFQRDRDSDEGLFRRERLLRLRSLQELQRAKQQSSGGESIVKTDVALDVIITFDGFTIGMNPERMSELLVLGIDSVDFSRELQQSRIDFFSKASVSSATQTGGADSLDEGDVNKDKTKNNSNFSVIISYMVPIVVIGFALGSLFYHKCYIKRGWAPRYSRHYQNALERTQIGGMSATPMCASNSNSTGGNSNDGDNKRRFLNFRNQVSTSFHTDEGNENMDKSNKEEVGRSSFGRIFSALNLNLAMSKSKNSTDDEDNYEANEIPDVTSSRSSSSSDGDLKLQKNIPVHLHPLVSPITGESAKKAAISFDKGFASVLPPMIVIDNIDGPDIDAITPVAMAASSTIDNNKAVPDSSARPTNTQIEELDAFASEFRKQLLSSSSNSINGRHQAFTGSFYGMTSSPIPDPELDHIAMFGSTPNSNDEDDDRQLRSMVSDEWDGDDLFSPIPSNITTNDDGDENKEDLIPPSNAGDDEGLSTSPSGTKKRIYETWDGTSPPSAAVPNMDSNLSAASMPVALFRDIKPDLSLSKGREELPPKRPPTPERLSNNLRKNVNGSNDKYLIGSDQHHRRPSFPKANSAISFTQIVRTMVDGNGSSTDTKGHKRKSSSGSVSDLGLTKNNSSVSGLTADDSDHSRCFAYNRLEFEAPREGNWGLVLESSSRTGPRIYAVKAYSPLYGLIQKGDKLLEIDGKNVSQSSLTDVTKLLKGKSSSYRSTSTTMPIVVSRSIIPNIDLASSIAYNGVPFGSKERHHQHPLYADYNHKRDNSHSSYGSYGSGGGSSGSRIVEDVDSENSTNNNSVYYIDQQNRDQYNSLQNP